MGRQIFTGISDSEFPVKGGCINCHAYREADGTLQGGNSGPDLTMTYRARGADFIKNHVRNPRSDVMDSPMPPFANILGEVEMESVVRFLESFTYRLDAGRPPDGKRLYVQLQSGWVRNDSVWCLGILRPIAGRRAGKRSSGSRIAFGYR